MEAGLGKLEGRAIICKGTSAGERSIVLHDPPPLSHTRCEFSCRCVSAELPVNVLNWQPGHLRRRAGVEKAAAAQLTLLPVEIPILSSSE